MKVAIKKVTEGAQIACVSKQVVTTKSFVNEEKEYFVANTASEKRETESVGEEKEATLIENIDVEGTTTPCTSSRDNLCEEIPAASPVLDELVSRKRRKTKLLTTQSSSLFFLFSFLTVAAICSGMLGVFMRYRLSRGEYFVMSRLSKNQ